jgi:hypothetical protein
MTSEVDFITGPLLPFGSADNPWPWHDATALEGGRIAGAGFPAEPPEDQEQVSGYQNYYDQILCQYQNYLRSDDPEFLGYARKAADCWWKCGGILEGTNRNFQGDVAGPTSYAPRMAALSGLMLRALDGRPEMWDWINEYVRSHLGSLMRPAFIDGTELYNGVRDPGFVLLYAANLARVLPDRFPLQAGGDGDGVARRAEITADVIRWITDYWRRLQYEDGSWRWGTEAQGYYYTGVQQPFHVGILLEGLIQAHRLTELPEAQDAILASVTNLYLECFDTQAATAYPEYLVNADPDIRCRWFSYFRYGGWYEPAPPQPNIYDAWPGNPPDLSSGWANGLIEARETNSTVMHAFGYAYQISGDERFIEWGDDVFSASFGGTEGPGSDGYTGLAYLVSATNAKTYNQNYRASGRYLGWRGEVTPPPATDVQRIWWPTSKVLQNKVVAEMWATGYRFKSNLPNWALFEKA